MANSGASIPHPTALASVKPADDFSAEKSAEALRKAMKGLGTDEDAIIRVLTNHCNFQRVEIEKTFKTMYGRDLKSDLKSEVSGKFLDIALALLEPPRLYDAQLCNGAIKGVGTDEDTLIEVLSTRSNKDILEINKLYRSTYKRELERDIQADTSGHFKRLLVSLVTGNREEPRESPDLELAKKEAGELYQAGAKKLGTDESTFNRILCLRSAEQLRETFNQYKILTKKDIEDAIKSETSGNLCDGFLAIVKSVKSPSAFFAERLHKSMKGAGTDDKALRRLIVTRSEVDMETIKRDFHSSYGKSLASFIDGDTSGDYKKILLALVKA